LAAMQPEAVAHFSKELERNPRSADAAYNLSLALLRSGRAGEALAALDRHPAGTADHHALRGAVLNALGRREDAIPPLRRAVSLDPANASTLYDLVVTLLETDNNGEAVALLADARARFPKEAKIHAASGMAAYLTGKNPDAVRHYEAAVKLEPGAADFHASLGDVQSALGDLVRAETAYAMAVRLDATEPEFQVKRGRNLVKLDRTKEAEAAFAAALRLDPDNAEAHFQTGKLSAARADHAAALKHLEKAVAGNPRLKEAWYQLSLAYRRAGRADQAKDAAERFRLLP